MSRISHIEAQIFVGFIIDKARQRLGLTEQQLETIREQFEQIVEKELEIAERKRKIWNI